MKSPSLAQISGLVLTVMTLWINATVVFGQQKPNIILINLDDADLTLMSPEMLQSRFPNLARFVNQGIRFSNFHVTTPLCGPSRASLLRGQYAHRTGIRVNNPDVYRSNGFDGGMRYYYDQGYFEDDLSIWMKNAGYHNMMVGKFLHARVMNYVPPGWDDFCSYLGADYYGTYRFSNQTRPSGKGEQMPVESYRTTLEMADAVRLISEHTNQSSVPFFMYLCPLAPHQPSRATSHLGMVGHKYKNWWPGLMMPKTPDFDEADILDKTTAIARLPRLNQAWLDLAEIRYRERILAMKSVDDMFGAVYQTVGQAGQLYKTYFILTSDNGFHLGHHRLFGKADCFDGSSHVMTYVIGPGVSGGQQSHHLLANIDIAPTVVDLAGGQVPGFVDGKSFKQLILDPDSVPETQWRNAILIENWESKTFRGQLTHLGSTAIRMYNSIYAEWANGTSEYYDLSIDPNQLDNRYNQLASGQKSFLANYLRSLRSHADAPRVTISEPWDMNSLIPRHQQVGGMAEDDQAIDRVVLVVRRLSDFYFWSGSQWQEGYIRINAQLTNPGQQLTRWSLASLPDVESADEMIGVWARSYDADGNYDRVLPANVFRIDVEQPTSEILSPADGAAISGTALIAGTATDNRMVVNVRLVIKELNNQRFWNGTQWQSNWGYLTIPVDAAGTWSYSHPSVKGNLFVSTRAIDDSRNVQNPPNKRRFSVSN